MSSNILVVADPHSQPGTDQSRFSWLGRLVVDKKPDVVICLGDWAEMGSLSQYDVGKVSSEGKRYASDIACANEAIELFESQIAEYNKEQRRNKKKTYNPDKYMVYGNHESRVDVARQSNPKFFDTFSLDDFNFVKYGWTVCPMTKPTIIEGIAFAHYFTSGVMGRPIGGANHARNLLLKNHCSSVVGHSHLIDLSVDQDATGKPIFGLVAGCCFDYDMDWTTENSRYWRGVIYLHDCSNGWAYPEFLGMEYLRRKYGDDRRGADI